MTASGRQQVIVILEELLDQWRAGPPGDWENHSIPEYLEAMSAWLSVYEHSHANRGQSAPADGWIVFAQALRAAAIYE
jgi:hypothetical protein